MKPRARIGMIYPASGLMEREFVEMVPPDVYVHITRVKFGKASVEENLQIMEGVEESFAPYSEDIVEFEKKFFESRAFNVAWTHAENITDTEVHAMTNPSKRVGLAGQLPVEADDLFISCAGIEIIHRINEIETSLRRPVVTSNQASVWACLKKLGIEHQSVSSGQLMRNF